MDDAVADYLRTLAAIRADTTVRGNRHVLERFAAWYGPCQVRYMRPEKVQEWFVHLRHPHTDRSRVRRKPIQASTYNHYLSRLKSFFAWMTKNGVLKKDLLRDVERMRETQKARLQPDPDQMVQMTNSARSPRDRAFLATFCYTGLRQGEVTALRVGDVDLDSGYLAVDVSKSALQDRFPISAELHDALTSWMDQYARDLGGPLASDYALFPAAEPPKFTKEVAPDGRRVQRPGTWKPYSRITHATRIVQEALRRVGLDARYEGTHTLRRGAARAYFRLLNEEKGYDDALRITQAFLHHKNSATTESYLGLSVDKHRRDESLRGKPFLTAMVGTPAEVLPLRRAQN